MSQQQFVTLNQISELLNVKYCYVKNGRRFIADFPKIHRVSIGGSRRYLRHEILTWAQGKDLERIFREAAAKDRRGDQDLQAQRSVNMELSRRMIAGEFHPADERQQFEFKRLTARTIRPKTIRITVVPDWMQEEPSHSTRSHRRQNHG